MSAVIPARVVEFLRGPSIMHVGTRDGSLRPAHSHVTGAIVDDDLRTVTFFVTEQRAKRVLSDLENNGRVTLTAAQATHEAYQLKGSYVSSHPATEAEYAFQDAYRNKLWPGLAQVFPEEVVKPMVLGTAYRPSVAITFRVEHVFQQTPGPGAGEELV
jgi:hypothetical protein